MPAETKVQQKPVVQKKQIPLIKSASSFKINIPASVEAKIRHLCSVVHDVEWSGTLFYKYTGSFDDGTFEVTCVDLYVMDIGSSAYTEFKESADIISYRIENDLLDEDIFEGLIHSHNNMGTFFSATDCNTLIEEGSNMHHFVSLIVNNAGEYTAAVTRRVVVESKYNAHIEVTETKYYNTYKNDKVVLEQESKRDVNKEKTDEHSVIEYFPLTIVKEDSPFTFADIDTRLSEIRKSKSKTYHSTYKPASNVVPISKQSPQQSSYYPNSPYPYGDWYDDDYDWDNYSQDTYHDKGYFGEDYYRKDKVTEKTEKKVPTLEEINELPLCLQEQFNPAIVEELCAQALTGSVLLDINNFDPVEWVKKMDTIYEKRFGFFDETAHPGIGEDLLLENKTRLETWIESMMEFLVYTRDESLLSRLNLLAKGSELKYDESDTAEVCAFGMYQYLDALPYSAAKQMMLDTLTTYLPHGVEDYL